MSKCPTCAAPLSLAPDGVTDTASAVVAAWDRLGKCQDEFGAAAGAYCDEYQGALDDAIIKLRGALAATTK